MATDPVLRDALRTSLELRRDLLPALHAEGSDCYRLLHGAVEGAPGVTVDRYGPVLLAQTWREPLGRDDLAAIEEEVRAALDAPLTLVWNHRGDGDGHHPVEPPADPIGLELGLSYDVRPRHRGQDPLLFLDLRALRRRVLAHAADRVLNLFAYTGGIALCAARAGAREVWNVDFAAAACAVAEANAARNALPAIRVIRDDALSVIRQLAGLPAGRFRPDTTYAPDAFDLVVLDPPRWSKGKYGAVDVVRDYPSLFKPALLATRPGGVIAATNHVPSVSWDEWADQLDRCARKAGRPLASLERIPPEADFPSPDGQPPLKIAWCRTEAR